MNTLLWIAGSIAACLPLARGAWKWLTTFHVGVTSKPGGYSILRDDRCCRVVVEKWCPRDVLTVATLDLSAVDADEKLIEAKVLAMDRCRQLNNMARSMR